jgi:hypothetical protein
MKPFWIPTGKYLVAKRIVGLAVPKFDGNFEIPNWLLNDFIGMKGSTAERRLRELRKDYERFSVARVHDDPPAGWAYWGYRESFNHKNYWTLQKEFVSFLDDYIKIK